MQLTVLGSSGSYPVPGRPGSGFLLEDGPTRVWLEAGPGTFAALGDVVEPDRVSAVVVSHRHPDHSTDLFAAMQRWAFGEPARRGIPLLAPSSVVDAALSFLDGGPDHVFHRVFAVDPVDHGDEREIGPFRMAFHSTRHSVPTLASRWSAGGRTLAYSADTGPGGAWSRVAQDADLFLCEASLQQEPEAGGERTHLTAAEAGAIARERGARRLMITHVPAHLDPLVSVESAETTFGRPVALAVPGTRHKV